MLGGNTNYKRSSLISMMLEYKAASAGATTLIQRFGGDAVALEGRT